MKDDVDARHRWLGIRRAVNEVGVDRTLGIRKERPDDETGLAC
jgi:hypothetical protein